MNATFVEDVATDADEVPFARAFSTIKSLRLELEDLDGRGVPSGMARILRSITYPGDLPCADPGCLGGGFLVGLYLAELVRAGETSRRGTLSCRGFRLVRRRYRPCGVSLDLTVSIQYRGGEPAEVIVA